MSAPLAAAEKTTCAHCAAHVATLRTLATDRGDGEILNELDVLAARIAARAAAAALPLRRSSWRHPSEDDLSVQVKKTMAWLDTRALSHLEHEEVRVAVMLDDRLDVLAESGGGQRRQRAARVLEALLRERLERWQAGLETDAQEAFRRLARRLGGDSDGALSAESRLSYQLALPSGFLEPSALVDAIIDATAPRAYAWARLRRRLHRDVRLLLHANVTRIVDDLKQRIEDSARRLVVLTPTEA